jgi:3-deoxy-D-manno-octulosonic-acid transferase
VESVAGLERAVREWLLDANARHRAGEQGRRVVEQNRGALASVLAIIDRQVAAACQSAE